MVKWILLVILAAIGIFLVVAALQPSYFRIERTIAIQAQPAPIFEHLNDFYLWEKWSSWAKLDPAMKTVYAGPPKGEGATYSWIGNDEVGFEKGLNQLKAIAESAK